VTQSPARMCVLQGSFGNIIIMVTWNPSFSCHFFYIL